MLYPYRPSSVKNQQRWNFGVLCPPAYCEQEAGSESSLMEAQCLLQANASARLTVKVRFLQIVERVLGRFASGAGGRADRTGGLEFVDCLEIEGREYQSWQEAVERAVTLEDLDMAVLASSAKDFSFPSGESLEELRDNQGTMVGAIIRRWETLTGSVQLGAEDCGKNAIRLTVRVDNRSEFDASAASQRFGRDAALPHSLISAHMVLGVEGGEFFSLLDPPAGYEEAAAHCGQAGVWPVLAGENASMMLASPIILYDYPKIAPESAGNLFDGTEIDEILSLRILTLTEEEKAEIRRGDDRARDLLERTENIPEAQFLKLHGVVREMTALKEGSQ